MSPNDSVSPPSELFYENPGTNAKDQACMRTSVNQIEVRQGKVDELLRAMGFRLDFAFRQAGKAFTFRGKAVVTVSHVASLRCGALAGVK